MSLFELDNLETIEIVEKGQNVLIYTKHLYEPKQCKYCKSEPKHLIKHGTTNKTARACPIFGKPAQISINVQKYKCKSCSRSFTNKVPLIDERFRITKRLVSHIEKQSVKKTFLTVSHDTGVNENTVREIFTNFTCELLMNKKPKTPRVMGIDDVYIRRVPRCVITDIERKRVIDILPKRVSLDVLRYFFDLRDRERVECITMDMCRAFYNTSKRAFRMHGS